jgi:hypothetical protein
LVFTFGGQNILSDVFQVKICHCEALDLNYKITIHNLYVKITIGCNATFGVAANVLNRAMAQQSIFSRTNT